MTILETPPFAFDLKAGGDGLSAMYARDVVPLISDASASLASGEDQGVGEDIKNIFNHPQDFQKISDGLASDPWKTVEPLIAVGGSLLLANWLKSNHLGGMSLPSSSQQSALPSFLGHHSSNQAQHQNWVKHWTQKPTPVSSAPSPSSKEGGNPDLASVEGGDKVSTTHLIRGAGKGIAAGAAISSLEHFAKAYLKARTKGMIKGHVSRGDALKAAVADTAKNSGGFILGAAASFIPYGTSVQEWRAGNKWAAVGWGVVDTVGLISLVIPVGGEAVEGGIAAAKAAKVAGTAYKLATAAGKVGKVVQYTNRVAQVGSIAVAGTAAVQDLNKTDPHLIADIGHDILSPDAAVTTSKAVGELASEEFGKDDKLSRSNLRAMTAGTNVPLMNGVLPQPSRSALRSSSVATLPSTHTMASPRPNSSTINLSV